MPPTAVALARSWGVTDVPFGDLDELLELAGYRVDATPQRNDVLLRLVEIGRTDDLARADRAAARAARPAGGRSPAPAAAGLTTGRSRS